MPQTENQFRYFADNGELWLVIPEPEGNYEDYELGSHWNVFWFKKWESYNSRLHYSCSPELKAKLVDGQVLNGNEFATRKRSDFFPKGNYGNICVYCKKQFYGTDKLWFACKECCDELIAIPLPEANEQPLPDKEKKEGTSRVIL